MLNCKNESDYTFVLNTFSSQIVSSTQFLTFEVIISHLEKALINGIQNLINNYHLNEQLNKIIKIH